MIPIRPPHRLTTQDASFLYGESHTAPLHFGGLATFAGAIDYDRLIRYIDARLPLVPRFRERLVYAPLRIAHPAMEPDPDFKLTNHVRLHELIDPRDDAVMREVMRVFEPPLSRERPLWELHLFRGLAGGRSALLWKIHHAIVDGVSWVQVLNAILACSADEQPPRAETESDGLGVRNAVADAVRDLARMQLAAARRIARGIPIAARAIRSTLGAIRPVTRPAATAPWNASLVSGKRTLARALFPLDRVQAVRHAFRASLNDVAVAALAEAAARYLVEKGVASEGRSIQIGCPVSVRSLHEMGALGNRVSMMMVETAAQPGDPVGRLKAIARETARIKASHESEALDALAAAGDFVPPSLMAAASPILAGVVDAASAISARAPRIAGITGAIPPAMNFIATNVRGPDGPRFVAGHEMLDYAGMIPLGGNVGYGVVICTYNHRLSLGLMADPRMLPDVERMKSLVADAFDDLIRAAEKVAPHHPEHPKAA